MLFYPEQLNWKFGPQFLFHFSISAFYLKHLKTPWPVTLSESSNTYSLFSSKHLRTIESSHLKSDFRSNYYIKSVLAKVAKTY